MLCSMKIRNGFVSNSSSSSFIILGVDVNKVPNYKEYDGISIDGRQVSTLYLEWKNYNEVIGFVLANYSDEDGMGRGIYDYNKITELSHHLSHKFNIPIEEIELIFGTMP